MIKNKRTNSHSRFLTFFLLIFSMCIAPPTYAVSVVMELALLVDISSSVNEDEYALQKNGYEAAFRNDDVINSILEASSGGGIAVTYIEYAGNQSSGWTPPAMTRIGWTHITDRNSSIAFANLLQGLTKIPGTGGTNPHQAIEFSVPLFGTETGNMGNGFESQIQVIDVSGDGEDSFSGDSKEQIRDAALASGIDKINGLAILDGSTSLEGWYNQFIKGGDDAFVIAVDDFSSFGTAIETKLLLELEVPQPTLPNIGEAKPIPTLSSWATISLGIFLGLFSWYRLNRKQNI